MQCCIFFMRHRPHLWEGIRLRLQFLPFTVAYMVNIKKVKTQFALWLSNYAALVLHITFSLLPPKVCFSVNISLNWNSKKFKKIWCLGRLRRQNFGIKINNYYLPLYNFFWQHLPFTKFKFFSCSEQPRVLVGGGGGGGGGTNPDSTL
jgi:hypothetical protein